jgi:predicted enzyme related to lactoylglutathione lyase
MPVGDIKGVGRFAYIRDPEMNLLGILKPDTPMM